MTRNAIWNGAGAPWRPAGDYLLEWDLTGADGAASLGSAAGTGTVGVTVSTPPANGRCDAFTLRAGQLTSNDVGQPTICEIAFDQPVKGVNFRLIDVDQAGNWDDMVTVLGYDPDGNLVDVDVDVAAIRGAQATTGTTIEGEADPSDAGATVSVIGPIVKLVIVHDTGPDARISGRIMVTDLGFDAMPTAVGDLIVEGTGSDNGIDLAHTGDPDGDARLPGGEGGDAIYGIGGEDHINSGAGADTLSGGADRDWFAGSGVGDRVDGDEGGEDRDTPDLAGSAAPAGSFGVTYTTPDRETGDVSYADASGNDLGRLEFHNIGNVVPCFTPATMIATPKGEMPVETLKAGDRVITRDNGIQEIMWVGARTLPFSELAKAQHLAPILIRAGALGNGLPERDTMLSPNHRVLVSNDRTSLYFDEREVFAAAKHLVNSKGIRIIEPLGVTYVHFMCRNHEVVLSNGAWTESFQPSDYSLKGVGNAQRQELFELFPELATRQGREDYTAARRILRKHEAQVLLRS